jgi:hypothetical protein
MACIYNTSTIYLACFTTNMYCTRKVSMSMHTIRLTAKTHLTFYLGFLTTHFFSSLATALQFSPYLYINNWRPFQPHSCIHRWPSPHYYNSVMPSQPLRSYCNNNIKTTLKHVIILRSGSAYKMTTLLLLSYHACIHANWNDCLVNQSIYFT